MREIRKRLEFPKLEYYYKHLSIINCILPEKFVMKPREIEVLACFMSLEGEVTSYRFGPTGRKMVRAKLGLSFSGLSNYMIDFEKKELLIKNGDILEIAPLLFPEKDEQVYSFKLVNLS